MDDLAAANIAQILREHLPAITGPNSTKRKKVLVFVVNQEYDHATLAQQTFTRFSQDPAEATSNQDVAPDIDLDDWLKLRCLVSPSIFSQDPFLQDNHTMFALNWSGLHSLDAFDKSFKMKPHSKKCFGYKIMKGFNDLRSS